MHFNSRLLIVFSIYILATGNFCSGKVGIPEEEIENIIRAGNQCLLTDRLDEAIREYDRAIGYIEQGKPKKEYALVYYKRGRAHERKKHIDQALSDYRAAIEYDPVCLLAYYGSGELYMQKGNLDRALEQYQKIVEIDSRQPHAYNNIGLAYMQKEDYAKAVPCFTKAIELDPDFVNAHHNRAMAYLSRRNYYDALLDLDKEVELMPGSFVAKHYRLAVYYFFDKKYDQAFEEVKMLKKTREPINPVFLNELRKESGRETGYVSIDDTSIVLQSNETYVDAQENNTDQDVVHAF
ncbi:MAG: tetratricopeptide repeat protein [Candidatus Omnitrophica bacterium]|nr:tetratricopeptide repeat protein [Candidatus Omnitrophota bacterium]